MKSPRFEIRAAQLATLFAPAKLRAIWTKKVRLSMRDQLLKDPIEHFDVTLNLTSECEKLSQSVLSGSYAPSAARRLQMEKSRGLCRQIVISTVHDAIILQTLSDALYPEITKNAPTRKSFYKPADQKFSGSGNVGYGNFRAWLNFQREILRFSTTRRYVVVTDIANYYDSISYVHLRNVLSGISGAQECTLDMLLFVLSALLWQPDYMPRVDIGLPQIDLDAPRLLAHCFLYELDEFLQKEAGDFSRYMDDIDVGVDSVAAAKRMLKSIDLVLQTRQIRLNSGKTKILNQLEARRHFRVSDNATIDARKLAFSNHVKIGASTDGDRKWVVTRIYKGLDSRDFEEGNGEKILKRLIGFAGDCGARLHSKSLLRILHLWPSLREAVYRYISRDDLTPARVAVLRTFVKTGMIVDEAGPVEVANFLVETRVPGRWKVHEAILEIADETGTAEYHSVHSSLWLLSKYGTRQQVLDRLKTFREVWTRDDRLGRLAGGLYPIFSETAEWPEFLSLIQESRNEGARTTYKFHTALETDISTFNSVYKYLAAPNISRSTGITHAKFLCLLSALRNTGVGNAPRAKLRDAHAAAWKDVYYKGTASGALKTIH